MSNSSKGNSKISPQLRDKLLKESRHPWKGFRRGLWIALFASAMLGLFIMGTNALGGRTVLLKDISIQLGSLIVLGTLFWLDKPDKQ